MLIAVAQSQCYNAFNDREVAGRIQRSLKEVFKMKFAYKVLKNKEYNTTSSEEIQITKAAEVSFIMVAKGILGFRESARLVKIAEETNCMITVASGKKLGSTESILSMVNLGILPGKSLVLNIKGERNDEAFRMAAKVINGETDSNVA